MKEYIKVPHWIDINQVYEGCSVYKFLKNCTYLECDKIDIKSLREEYKKDPKRTLNLIDELSLRGFEFYCNKENNFLPKVKYEINEVCIYSESDEKKYRKINFENFMIESIISRFNIKEDRFFNDIPLNGFKVINPNIDLELLGEALKKNGFIIKDGKSCKKALDNLSETNSNRSNEEALSSTTIEDENQPIDFFNKYFQDKKFRAFEKFCKQKCIFHIKQIDDEFIKDFQDATKVSVVQLNQLKEHLYYTKQEIERIHTIHNMEREELIEYYSIKKYFSEKKYDLFRVFCLEHNIYGVWEVNERIIDTFAQYQKASAYKINQIRERMEEVLKDKKEIPKLLKLWEEQEEVALLQVDKVDTDFSVQQYFYERKYEMFRKFCMKKGIENIDDIEDGLIKEFSIQKGIGSTKVEQVIKRLSEGRNQIQMLGVSNDVNLDIFNNYAIEPYFEERKYGSFIEFCRQNQITYLNQLTRTVINQYRRHKNVSDIHFEQIKSRLDEIRHEIVTSQSLQLNLGNQVIVINESLYPFICDLSISQVLAFYGENYSNNEFIISSLNNELFKDIVDEQDYMDLQKAIVFINSIKMPQEVVEISIEAIDETQKEVLKKRMEEGETLQKIASDKNVSRERIRQIESKGRNILDTTLNIYRFYETLKLIVGNKYYIKRKNLIELLGEEGLFFTNFLISQEQLKVFRGFDILYFEEFKASLDQIEAMINGFPEFFFLEEYIEEIEQLLKEKDLESTTEQVSELLEYYGYKRMGRCYSKRKLTCIDILEYLFREHQEIPLTINEEAVTRLKKLSYKHFAYNLSDSVRAVEARITDIEEVILIAPRTYCHINNMNYDEQLIEEIEAFIRSEFEVTTEVNIENIFKKYEVRLKKSDIQEKHALYSLIRYRGKVNFKIHKNTLVLFREDIGKINTDEERLRDYLNSYNGKAIKSDILKDLKWKGFKLENVIGQSKDILKWGKLEVILSKCIQISAEEKSNLRKFIDSNMQKGYTTTSLLFYKMLLESDLKDFVSNNNIDEYSKLGNVIKCYFPYIKGSRNFLYLQECKLKSMEDVILHEFIEITTRDEIRDMILSYRYSEMMTSSIIENLLLEGKYLEISNDELIPKEKLDIGTEAIEAVIEQIKSNMGEKPYVSLSSMKGYRRKLPDLGHLWNEYLLKTVAMQEKNCFRIIQKIYRNYRYDKVILVDAASNIYTFEDLIYYILKNEYTGNMHEIKIYDYLVEMGILYTQRDLYSKKLPYEIYQSRRIEIDNLGRVTIKEV